MASMPLLWFSLAFLGGILLASFIPWTTAGWLLSAGIALLVALLLRTPLFGRLSRFARSTPLKTFPLTFSLIPCFLLLGAARYQSVQPDLADPGFIAFYNDTEETFVVRGVLAQPPDVRDSYINLRVQAGQLRPDDGLSQIPVSGLLLVKTAPGDDWHYGDQVLVRGKLQTPPKNEDFSYRDYLARQGVYTYVSYGRVSLLERGGGNRLLSAIYAFKARSLALIYRLWPDPEASLLAGILLGVETGIPQSVQQAFKNTGTSHIIAISGFNISIIAALFVTVFSRLLGARRGALLAGLGIAGYTLLVGADAAVVRAAIMGGLSLLARQVGRRQHGLNSLAVTAAAMALVNPYIPWDAGFQLSFAATLGLVLYAEPFSQAFVNLISRSLPLATAQRLAGPVGEYFLFTLAAQLTTLPIIAYYFRRISLSSLLANPVILPVQPPVMILGGLAVLLGNLYLPLGKLAAPLAWPFVVFTIRAVELLGKNPGGVLILGRVALFWVILFYGVLFLTTLAGSRLKGISLSLRPSLPLSALGIAAILVWRAALSAPDGRLHLDLLAVGASGQSGDAVLIQTPTGRYLLINGGPSAAQLSNGLGRRLPLFHRKLDYLIVASPRDEQLAALPGVIERYPPANVLWAGSPSASRSARYLQESLAESQTPSLEAHAGQILDLGGGAQLQVLTVGKRGAILLLEWQHFRALLPLGADFADLETLHLGRDVGAVSVLWLADNGYAPINPSEWLAHLHPQLILLSVVAGDRDGLPSPETLEAVRGYTLLRSDQNGWVHLSTDGQNLWVEVER